MVCYARPAAWLVAIVAVAWLVFSGPVSHFFGTAALMAAVTVATAGAAVAAALVFATFMSARRRRAAAGGCVSCRFRCQHAMTEQARRLWLVTTADRTPPRAAPGHRGNPGHQGTMPPRSVPVLLPMPAVRSAVTPAAASAPRWPDRPAHRASQVPPLVPAPRRERVGSPG
jgi:hypothetical protein